MTFILKEKHKNILQKYNIELKLKILLKRILINDYVKTIENDKHISLMTDYHQKSFMHDS